MAELLSFAPTFPVADLDRALEHYRKMGFVVRAYEGGGYGFATRDGCELHLGTDPHEDDHDHRHSHTAAYLRVRDADALAAEWRAAGVEVHGPEDTEWGQHEGATIDPDGNVIRFGSPM
jgi:catechol 2,3-dioxygenase-like lactoylglutathione lyase family enzyme